MEDNRIKTLMPFCLEDAVEHYQVGLYLVINDGKLIDICEEIEN